MICLCVIRLSRSEEENKGVEEINTTFSQQHDISRCCWHDISRRCCWRSDTIQHGRCRGVAGRKGQCERRYTCNV